MMKMYINGRPMDNEDFENIVSYMDDEIRENLHGAIAPCSNEEFLTAYLEKDPDFMELLESEFGFDQKSEIKIWRTNAMMTQQEMSDKLGIPKRTIENWEGGKRSCPEWAERLIVEKLMQLTEERAEKEMQRQANGLKSDEEGNRPLVRWAVVTRGCDDEYLEICKSMQDAIKNKGNGDIYCILTNKTGDWFIERDADAVRFDPWFIDPEK